MTDTTVIPDEKPDTPPETAKPDKPEPAAYWGSDKPRSELRTPGMGREAAPRQLSDPSEIEALAPGTKFMDPGGKTRIKPWSVRAESADSDLASVPEGGQFLDPTGKLRQKPTFEPIAFTAQTLYDMSVTPSEKRKALERSYPGKVKEDAQGLYVEEDGKFRRPGRGLQGAGGFVASAAAPTAGAALGAVGLGAVGGPVGGAVGGATGSFAGQIFNDGILQLAGVYDRTPTEEAANLGKAGIMGSAGAGVGRGIAALVPAAKAGVSSAGQMLPAVAAKFLGAGPELTAARELAEKGEKPGEGMLGMLGMSQPGTAVPPSAWAHQAPHVQNLAEVFDPAFRTNKPLLESATKHYEDSAAKVLDDLGVKREGSVLKPAADVPTQAAGEKVLQKTLAESAEADTKLQAALEQRKVGATAGAINQSAQREVLLKASEESKQAAQKLIDANFETIQREADVARKLSGSGINTGDLWENIGNKFMSLRRAFGERANYWYERYGSMTEGYAPDTSRATSAARQALDELPEEFKNRYPTEVAKLKRLAGETGADGEVIKEPEQLSYAQVHDLRSLFRGNADWYTLSSDFRNGSWKYFSKELDGVLHDPNAPEAVQQAGKFLSGVDKWYGENMKLYNAQQVKAIMKGLEAGEPADPGNLYKAVVKEGQSDTTRLIRDKVGPTLWAGVRAADVDAMMAASKTFTPGEVNGRLFAKEILDRHQRNLLEVVHGKEASEKLLNQARAIEQLDGRLNIPVKPGDTMTQVVARARLAAEEAKAQGTKDPLSALQKDIKRLENESKRETSLQRRNDPLGFLYNKSTGASYAVDKILGNEDLILAATARFGEKSPEFDALRQVYVERLFRAGLQPGKKLEGVSPEVQQLMFPGVTLEQTRTLAKEMDLLLSTRANVRGDTAGGMAAMSKVEHPVGGKLVSGITKFIPGVNPGGRAALGAYFKLVTDIMTSPSTLRWVEKGLTKGTPEEQEAVREILRRHLQKGSTVGAAVGESVYQGSGQ